MRRLAGTLLFLTSCFSVSNVPTPKTCPAGQASRYDGSAWQCESPVPVCEGGFPTFTGSTWACGSFPVVAPPNCPNGFLSWSGNGWSCGTVPTDLTGALATPEALATHFGQVGAGTPNTTSTALSMYGSLSPAPIASTGEESDPGCLTVKHNWNTNAVNYTAWYSDTTTGSRVWIPVPVQANVGTMNVALLRPVTADPTYTSGDPGLLTDGQENTATGFAVSAASIPTSSRLTIDLGATYRLDKISVSMNLTGGGGTGNQIWHASLSDHPGAEAAATLVASGSCPAGQSCAQTYPLSGSPSGRYLSWTCDQYWGNSTTNMCFVNEIQAYAVAGYSVFQPNANSVRVCNYSGTTRDLALRVSR